MNLASTQTLTHEQTITHDQALACFASEDLIGLGMEADAIRRALHPESVVTYTVQHPVADSPQLHHHLTQARDLGASAILLTPAANWTPDFLAATITTIRRDFPSLSIQSLTAANILTTANPHETLARLQSAGLDTIDGARTNCSLEHWLSIHRIAHSLGMRTTASITFGTASPIAERLAELEAIHSLQSESLANNQGSFIAFLPISGQPRYGVGASQTPDESTSVEYLKTLAIARILLGNIPNIQTAVQTQGLKVLQMGLRFGANDVGALLPAPAPANPTEEELRRTIRDANFRPAHRNLTYTSHYL